MSRVAELEAVVEAQAVELAAKADLEAVIDKQAEMIARLEERIAVLERQAGQNSGNSGKPPSRDTAEERQRQAAERAKRRGEGGSKKRRKGKQPGAPGKTLAQTDTPDVIEDHRPAECSGCGASLDDAPSDGFGRRQVIDLPEPKPVVTEHRAHACTCPCGATTTGSFPDGVRAPVSYGPRLRSVVAYLLGRQHIPNRRVAETVSDLFGLDVSPGTIDSIYAEAGRRLSGFIAALVSVLRSLPVLHADETTDRVGTDNWWLHVTSTAKFTLIHASKTRGLAAIEAAGVLVGYRGVIVHDRLAMYWKLKRARHGVCAAHLLRDLAEVAIVATQTGWATGMAALLNEINQACEQARLRGLKQLAPHLQRGYAARYDALVCHAREVNPAPPQGRKRDSLQRRSHNLAEAFAEHRRAILQFMYDLSVPATNNQGERDLRPAKLHRKISGCYRSPAGAERSTHLRSYLSTTRKHDITAIDALTRLFNGDPWMPTAPAAT